MFKLYSFFTLAILTFGLQAQNIDVYGPAPFRETLNNDFSGTWTPSAYSEVENLQYFVLLDADTKSKALTLSSDDNSSLIVADVSTLTETYGSVLRSMFQIVDINSNTEDDFANKYRVVPLLHTYFALNYSTESSEVFSVDMGSYYVDEASESGYLVVEFEGSPSAVQLKASGQYSYNSSTGSQEENSNWTTQWFVFENDKLTLTTDENVATTFFMADARDLIDNSIEDGSDFDPTSIEWQINPFADYPYDVKKYEDSDFYGAFLMDVDDAYESQFGDHESTLDAATAALEEIENTLNANGESMRYDKEVYLAFRENMLSKTLEATDIYNGRLGERLVAYVYFTNATDDSGEYHPFMVIGAHGISDSPNYLIDVSRPPGDGSGGGYAEQSITRNAVLGYFLFKIPLKDYGLIDNLLDNDIEAAVGKPSLAEEAGLDESEYDVYNYIGPSSQAVAIDGVPVYPAYNNNLRFAPEDGEITSTGIHVGRGMGLHYHADGHGFNHNGLNLYNLSDYEGKNHPPMIGFAYDGIVICGRYEENYSAMSGYDVALDEYGGHDHDGFGYHYHAFSEDFEALGPTGSDPVPFTQHFFNVGAWRGNINSIPGFLEVTPQQLKNEDIARFAGASYESGEPTSGSAEVEACDSYEWEGTTYTASGSYTITLTNSEGGDSTATLNLTINNSFESTIDESACDSYVFDGKTLTASGTYNATFTSSSGCDSLVTLNLTILESTDSTLDVSTCERYDFFGSTLTESGTYTEVIPNNARCDSLVTLNLTILDPESEECKSTVTGIGEDQSADLISVYPNPTDGQFTVDLGKEYAHVTLEILSISGKLIKTEKFDRASQIKTQLNVPSGSYLIRISGDDMMESTHRITKK